MKQYSICLSLSCLFHLALFLFSPSQFIHTAANGRFSSFFNYIIYITFFLNLLTHQSTLRSFYGLPVCKASSDNHFAFLHFLFLGMVLITASCTVSWTSIHSSSGTLSHLIPCIYLSLPLYNSKGFD